MTDTTRRATATATARATATDLAEARAARRGGGRWRHWVGGLVLVGLVAAVVWAVWFSPLLAVTSVRVVDARLVPTADVVAAADVPLGTPLARVDVAAVTARVTAIPRVASVEVRRGFPHELVLAIVERTGVAVLPRDNGFDVIDASGVRFSTTRTAGTLPVVAAADGTGVHSALDVLAALPDGVRSRVVRVASTTRDDVTLTLRSGQTVLWGDASRSELKAQVLTALLARRAGVYDVSAPDLPTTRG